MRKIWKNTFRVLSLFLLCAAAWYFPAECVKAEEQKALGGVYVEDVSVGGMTESEITEAVDDKMEQLKSSIINLYVGEQTAQVSAGELGLSCSDTEIAKTALAVGQQGNVLTRFRMKRELEKGKQVVLPLTFTVDANAAKEALETYAVPLNTEAVDASLTRENGEFVLNRGQNGYTVNVDASVEKVVTYMTENWRGGIGGVETVTDVTPAGGNPEQLALVKDVLGQGATEYGGSSAGRKKNVKTGAEKINGALLQPGEEFSVEDAVVPFTEENGYAPAPSYEMGKVVDTYGGGICQVSTTLYLAALRAELEITERYNHSMMVHYVDPSKDAAIAEGLKNLRFVNNTDAPIYIEGTADGSTIQFIIYGHETRDPNRKISYESETVSTVEPDTELSADGSAAFGSITQTSAGSEGAKARLWKIINDNGTETREQVNSSTYQAKPNRYSIGTNTEDGEAKAAMLNAIASNDLNQVKAVAAKYPGGKAPQAEEPAPESAADQTEVPDAQGEAAPQADGSGGEGT